MISKVNLVAEVPEGYVPILAKIEDDIICVATHPLGPPLKLDFVSGLWFTMLDRKVYNT